MNFVFSFLALLCLIYSFVCIGAIIISWVPGAKFTTFGKFITAVAAPYLNFFRRFKKLRIENVDFSPILALGILTVLNSLFSKLSHSSRITFAVILEAIVYIFWNLFYCILIFFAVIAFVRWIVLVVNHGQRNENTLWVAIDNFINRIAYKIASKFTKKPVKYTTALLITWIFCGVLAAVSYILFGYLSFFILQIPF